MKFEVSVIKDILVSSFQEETPFKQTELMDLAGGYKHPETQIEAYEATYFDDLAMIFPDVFAKTNLPATLNEFEAIDILRVAEERGRRGEDIALIEDAIKNNHEAWTLPALQRFENFLRRTHITPHQTVFSASRGWGEDAKIVFPSVDDLLSGRVNLFAFSRAVAQIKDSWFAGDVETMAARTGIKMNTLVGYIAGGLPASYEEVYKLGTSLKIVEVDGLANLWLGDMYARTAAIDKTSDERSSRPISYEERRLDILTHSAGLKLGRLFEPDKKRGVFSNLAGGMFDAIRAGFDPRTVIETFAEFLAPREGFLDKVNMASRKLVYDGDHFAASYILQMAAHHYRKEGDRMKAAVLTEEAADALVGADRFPTGASQTNSYAGKWSGVPRRYAKRLRVELLKQAMVDNTRSRAMNNLPTGVDSNDPFNKRLMRKLRKLNESSVDVPSIEAASIREMKGVGAEAKKPVVIIRRKNGGKQGFGSAGGGGGGTLVVESSPELPLVDNDAPVVNASSPRLALDEAVIEEEFKFPGENRTGFVSFIEGLHPDKKVAIDDFIQDNSDIWSEIEADGRIDMVVRAMNAASNQNKGIAVSSVIFSAALKKIAEGEGYFDFFMMEEGAKKTFGGQEAGRQFLTLPIPTPKAGF